MAKVHWTWRMGAFTALIAVSLLLISAKTGLFSSLKYRSAPTVQLPTASMSPDDQALFWTYALYDTAKFRSRFQVAGDFPTGRTQARRELENLLPKVSQATMGVISGYQTVAFGSARPPK